MQIKINTLSKLTILVLALSGVSTFSVAENSRNIKCEAYEAPSAAALAEWLTAHQNPEPQVKGIYFNMQTGQHTLIYCKWG